MNLYEELEHIEVEEPFEFATQADEHLMTYDQEQTYIKSIDTHVNKIWTKKEQTQ